MRKTTLTCIFSLLFSVTAFSQQVKLAAFQVERSALMEQIKAVKAADPKISAADLAKAANEILEKDGINAMISFDAATCEKIKKVRDARKDPNVPIRLNATLKSVEAEAAALVLPEPQFASDDCGGCYIEVPVLQLTPSDFVTRVRGQNIKFVLPANFSANQIELLDAKNPASVKRKWLVPFRSTPIGVSFDEDVVYLGFEDPELSLLVFGEGTFGIGTRKEAEEGGLGKIIEAAGNAQTKQIKFDRWKNSYLISYKNPCAK